MCMEENEQKHNEAREVEYLSIPQSKLALICRRYEAELLQAKDWMFWFLLCWTIILLLMMWMEFFFSVATPHTITAGYIVLLGGYIAHKEILRWAGAASRVRRGELFVYIWWGMLLGMFVTSYLTGRGSIPDSITTLCYEVLAYFIVTELSKALNAWQGLKRKK